MKQIYRIEHKVGKHGMWRDFNGGINPLLEQLPDDSPIKKIPMPDDNTYRYGEKEWFSAAANKAILRHWFKKSDTQALLNLGYEICELTVTDYRVLSEFEVVFNREAIISKKVITLNELYK